MGEECRLNDAESSQAKETNSRVLSLHPFVLTPHLNKKLITDENRLQVPDLMPVSLMSCTSLCVTLIGISLRSRYVLMTMDCPFKSVEVRPGMGLMVTRSSRYIHKEHNKLLSTISRNMLPNKMKCQKLIKLTFGPFLII